MTMDKKIKYKEKNRFNDATLMAMFIVAFGASIAALVYKIWLKATLTELIVLILVVFIIGGAIYWYSRLRLRVSLNDKRIKYKLSPLHNHSHKIEWSEVESCKIVKSPKMSQWHGSNIRFLGERFFSVTGRNGLEIETKQGQNIFLGFAHVDALRAVLDKIFSGNKR